MNRRKVFFIAGLLTLVGSGVLLMLPRKSTPFRLKIVRQTMA
jgi:hypothetical protein